MDPAQGKKVCGHCGSYTHQKRSSHQCPYNALWDNDSAKRQELAAAVTAELADHEADLDDGAGVIDLDATGMDDPGAEADNQVGATASVDVSTDDIASPANRAARRTVRLARAAATGRATTPTPVRGGAPSNALSPAPAALATAAPSSAAQPTDATTAAAMPTTAPGGVSGGTPTLAPAALAAAALTTPARPAAPTGASTPVRPAIPAGASTPVSAGRAPSPHTQMVGTMQAMMTMMMAQTKALAAIAQGLQTKSVSTSRPSSPRQDACAEFDANNGITHSTGSANTSFTATPQLKDRKITKLSNTSNIPTVPEHTAGLRKWRRDFCRYLDANAAGIGPLVCPDLYDATTSEVFDRTAMACAVEAIRIATTGTRAEDVLDDIDDEDVDPATLMERVVAYITDHDSDSSLVLERELESIAPVSTGTRVEQIDQVYKDIKDMERRYKANGLVRGADYFITRARLLIALHYPELTFSMDRSFRTLKGLFGEYHHRAADADELEQRTAAGGGTSGKAFPAASNGARRSTTVPSVAYKLAPGEPLPEAGTNWCDECKQNVQHRRHAPWCATCKRWHRDGECRSNSQTDSGSGGRKGNRGGNDRTDYKKSYATANNKLAEANKALAASATQFEEIQAAQEVLQARCDSNQALIAQYQTSGFQQELPGGPP